MEEDRGRVSGGGQREGEWRRTKGGWRRRIEGGWRRRIEGGWRRRIEGGRVEEDRVRVSGGGDGEYCESLNDSVPCPHTHSPLPPSPPHTHTLKDNAVGSYGHSLSMVALA